jgi:RNase P/RNase MRP subunit p29
MILHRCIGRDGAMNPHDNQNYTREQIIAVLQIIHDWVGKSCFILSKNEHRFEGAAETVAVCTKFNIIDLNEDKRVVVISITKRDGNDTGIITTD